MEFLKAILGEELYQQFTDKINLYNGTPENAQKQIKLANLGEGGYVSKDKYAALEATHNSKLAELTQANTLIADLQKTLKGNDEVQAKFQNYETQITDLQNQLQETKLKAALKFALQDEGVEDVDYITFKLEQHLKEEGKNLELDENEQIKGWDAYRDSLKLKFPSQFKAGVKKVVNPLVLNKPDNNNQGLTKQELLKKSYAERAKFAAEDPEAYAEIMNK